MEISKNIIELLVRLRNEDETQWLRTLKTILEHYHDSATPPQRDVIYAEADRLAKEIDGRIKAEKEAEQ